MYDMMLQSNCRTCNSWGFCFKSFLYFRAHRSLAPTSTVWGNASGESLVPFTCSDETLLTFCWQHCHLVIFSWQHCCQLVKGRGTRREEGRNHLSWEQLIMLAMAKSVLRSDIWRRFYRRQVRSALVKIGDCENWWLWKLAIVKIAHCENWQLWKVTIVKIAGDGILSAVSWHHYYLNGRTANIRFIVATIRYLS